MYECKKFPSYIFVFLAPAVIIYTVFMVFPLINSLRMSFYTVTADNQEVFAGLNNYVKLFTNSNFAPRFFGALKEQFHLLCHSYGGAELNCADAGGADFK